MKRKHCELFGSKAEPLLASGKEDEKYPVTGQKGACELHIPLQSQLATGRIQNIAMLEHLPWSMAVPQL